MQLSTVRDIQSALAQLKLPKMDQDAIASIGKFAGPNFKAAVAVLLKNTNDKRAQEYVAATLSAVSPATKQMFTNMGYVAPSPEILHPIFTEEGRSLRVAVSAMLREPTDDLKNYIIGTFGHLDMKPLTHAKQQAPHQEAEQQERRPTQQRQNSPTNLPSPRPKNSEPKTTIEGTHIYGGRCAFSFTKDKTRSTEMPTITIDSAPAVSGQDKTYNWKEKLAFQLTPSELPLVFGVLYGFMDKLELAGHGPANDKSLTVERQGQKYFFSMRGESKLHPMPAPAKDIFRVMALLLEQIKASYPELDTQALVALSKRVCDVHSGQAMTRAAA